MWVAALLGGYMLGSFPTAWIVTYLVRGEDLRTLGSGNVGVTNVAIQVSRWAGTLVFFSELGKGMLAVLIPRWLGADMITLYLSVCGAVLGTRWPVWLRFKGGRGNTLGGGALLLISWPTLLVFGGVWLLLRLAFRSSFLATRISFICLPVILGVATRSLLAAIMGAFMSLIYLSTQSRKTDDHLMVKARWSSLGTFLTMPRRNQREAPPEVESGPKASSTRPVQPNRRSDNPPEDGEMTSIQ